MLNRADYERRLYTLAEHHAEVTASTLRLYSNSATSSLVRGSVFFDSGLELRIFEYIDWAASEILSYSYTVYSGEEEVRWYDRSRTRRMPRWRPPFPIIITPPPTSNITVCQRQVYPLPTLVCRL